TTFAAYASSCARSSKMLLSLRSAHVLSFRRAKRGGIYCALLVALPAAAQQPGNAAFLRIDPDKIVISDPATAKPCGDCHKQEVAVWRATAHAQQYDSLHRKEQASEILRRMGFRTYKRQEAVCMRCHYTVGPSREAVAGVSCDSCHGPA